MKITIYSKEDCPWCVRAKDLMENLNMEYVEYVLGRDFDRTEFLNKFGEGSTFPRIFIEDELIGGAVDFAKWASKK